MGMALRRQSAFTDRCGLIGRELLGAVKQLHFANIENTGLKAKQMTAPGPPQQPRHQAAPKAR